MFQHRAIVAMTEKYEEEIPIWETRSLTHLELILDQHFLKNGTNCSSSIDTYADLEHPKSLALHGDSLSSYSGNGCSECRRLHRRLPMAAEASRYKDRHRSLKPTYRQPMPRRKKLIFLKRNLRFTMAEFAEAGNSREVRSRCGRRCRRR
jgi:hypothetical protein